MEVALPIPMIGKRSLNEAHKSALKTLEILQHSRVGKHFPPRAENKLRKQHAAIEFLFSSLIEFCSW